ncbi:hypothetical protein [Rhodospirillum sp. A1_3_36]|uniref:hypothetical protein n=1 Tax=Rhodospirillum sp. A1_3_36 TaxID=3391666 RepID=UPI0039A59190
MTGALTDEQAMRLWLLTAGSEGGSEGRLDHLPLKLARLAVRQGLALSDAGAWVLTDQGRAFVAAVRLGEE